MDIRSLLNSAQSSLSNSYDNSIDSVIDRLGLQRRTSAADYVLPALGVFTAGLAVGAALGLIFAPKKGEELRGDINDQLDQLKDRIDHLSVKSRRQYEELLNRGGELVESAKSHLPSNRDIDKAAEDVSKKASKAADTVSEKAHSLASNLERGAKSAAGKVENAAERTAEAAKNLTQK